MGLAARWILSPVRLPVPPLRQAAKFETLILQYFQKIYRLENLTTRVARPRIEKREGKPIIVFPRQAERLTVDEISRLVREERERQARKQ